MAQSPDVSRRVFSSHRRGSVILVTGGVRSGKSRFAVELAQRFGRRVVYVATCRPSDPEMRRRVARHRAERPLHWTTIEHPPDLSTTLTQLNHQTQGIVVDCLTMYVAELLTRELSDASIVKALRRLCRVLCASRRPVIVVTNEVGCGVVPEHPLGRQFRDLAGLANQMVAKISDQVVLMVAGIPTQVK